MEISGVLYMGITYKMVLLDLVTPLLLQWKTLTRIGMWPFRKGWTKHQKNFRRLCREEEKEVERMINFMEMNVETVKKAKAALLTKQATSVPTDPDAPKEGASTGLPEVLVNEFVGSGDPKGDACCYEPKCPCHEEK